MLDKSTIVALALPIIMLGTFGYLFSTGEIEFYEPPRKECILYHEGTVNNLNKYNKITYTSPKEICNVMKYYDSERIIGFDFSYEYQVKYSKSFAITTLTCDGVKFQNDIVVLDMDTMDFICPDGSIAKEYTAMGANEITEKWKTEEARK